MSTVGDVVASMAQPQDNPSAISNAWQAPRLGTDSVQGPADESAAKGLLDAVSYNLLAGYIRSSWSRNKRARDVIDDVLLACLRARRGIYASFELQGIWTSDCGDALYLPVAASKMRAAEGVLRELLLPEGDPPWGIDPSPVPDLPVEIQAAADEQASQDVQQHMQAAQQQSGNVMQFPQVAALRDQLIREAQTRERKAMEDEAKMRSERMEQNIEELMERGGYYEAIAEFIQHFCTYPTAILKGPYLRRNKRMHWDRSNKPVVISDAELAWSAVNTFDCYPAPEATSPQDGDFIERLRMTRADLYECIGVPGYNEAAIRRVLAFHQTGGLRAWLAIDMNRRTIEGMTHDVWIPDYLVDALHFWGSVEGRILMDYGITDGIGDPLAYYEVDAILIGNEVIRCEINDDPLGHRPYHSASYDPVPGAFWGNSIYQLMADCQAMINASWRALNANLGLASGPIIGVDVSQLAAGEDPKSIRPLQMIQLDRSRAVSAADPIVFYQAESMMTEHWENIEKCKEQADELTGIPRYLNGNQDASGAAETARGLSMLMATTSKGFRRAVASIDRGVIAPTVQAAYVHEMLYGDDESAKGDATVCARGSMAILVKEQLQQSRTQFLLATNNPTDMAIIGMQGRANLLREVSKNLEMPDTIVPDKEALAQQQAQQPPPQPSPDAQLKADTDIKKTLIQSQTKLGTEAVIHPAAAAAIQSLGAASETNNQGTVPYAPQSQGGAAG